MAALARLRTCTSNRSESVKPYVVKTYLLPCQLVFFVLSDATIAKLLKERLISFVEGWLCPGVVLLHLFVWLDRAHTS